MAVFKILGSKEMLKINPGPKRFAFQDLALVTKVELVMLGVYLKDRIQNNVLCRRTKVSYNGSGSMCLQES